MSASDSTCEVEYRTIPNYPGYRVGNDGTVWSLNKRQNPRGWRPLKPWVNAFGYPTVRLKNKSGYWSTSIHRLVLLRFVGDCPPGMVAAHNNGIPSDNRLTNLRWTTQADNMADKILHGTAQRGEKHGMAILSESDIPKIFAMFNSGLTCGEVGAAFGVATPTIQAIYSGRLWSHVERPYLRSASGEFQISLIESLIEKGYATAAIGSLAGVSQPMISMVRKGHRTMHLKHELALQSAVEKLFRPGQAG